MFMSAMPWILRQSVGFFAKCLQSCYRSRLLARFCEMHTLSAIRGVSHSRISSVTVNGKLMHALTPVTPRILDNICSLCSREVLVHLCNWWASTDISIPLSHSEEGRKKMRFWVSNHDQAERVSESIINVDAAHLLIMSINHSQHHFGAADEFRANHWIWQPIQASIEDCAKCCADLQVHTIELEQ